MTEVADREFSTLLEREGAMLKSFVLALVGDRHVTDDLYQSTCLELWRIRHTFQPGTNFGAWSRTVARYQILRHWRKSGREKVSFSSDAIARIAEAYSAPLNEGGDEKARKALETCLQALSEEQRGILRRRYTDGTPVRDLARETGRSEGGTKMLLVRLRQRLARCVKSKLGPEARAHGDDR